MGFTSGIIGLPNVGKSTIFNALTGAEAAMASYAFTTIEPNRGVVAVPDARLARIGRLLDRPRPIPATTTFIDIAGLVKGASRGEGLGNEFLGHIRAVDALIHVVRCFSSGVAEHPMGGLDPLRDISVVNTELALADLAQLERAAGKLAHMGRMGDKTAAERRMAIEPMLKHLGAGHRLRSLGMDPVMLDVVRGYGLITAKPVLYLANLGETGSPEAVPTDVRALADREGAQVLAITGKLEQEIGQIDPGEREVYRAELGLPRSGLDRLVETAYGLLDLITYYTATTELQAWAIARGTTAREAAGRIHTDFERGFIRAETVHHEDLERAGSFAAAREKGLVRAEGRDYVIEDGDVIHYLFNV